MRNLLNFLIEIGKLKEMPRRGWVLRKVKNPESIASHIFRSTFLAWFLAPKNLNIKKILMIALLHDICEVYAGDTTPYDSLLSKTKDSKKLTQIWPRFLPKEKKRLYLQKYQKEKKSLEKLISFLDRSLKREIRKYWETYENPKDLEGRFVRQADRVENLVQAVEYKKRGEDIALGPWWLQLEELIDIPSLINFIDVVEKKFYSSPIGKEFRNLKSILDFLNKIEKLKNKKRRGWLFHKIKNPETTAEHIFHLAILVLLLAPKKKINTERALKIALIHDICEVYCPDFTSYDAKGIKKNQKISLASIGKIRPKKGRPTSFQRKKLEKIKERLETKAIEKLCKELPWDLKKEILALWFDWQNQLSKEARFVKQADRIINLLQGLEYWEKYGRIQHHLWLTRAKETIEDPLLLSLLDQIEKRYFKVKK